MRLKTFVERFSPLIVAIVGVVGIVIGGTVTHFWTQKQMKEQQISERARALEDKRLEFRQKAYADFLRGQTMLWVTSEDKQKIDQVITNAKMNILLTGPKNVICAMVLYWSSALKYQNCLDHDLKRQDAIIYQQMRKDFFTAMDFPNSPDLDPSIIVPYLWSCILPEGNLEKMCLN